MAHEGLATYILKGGKEGRARLGILAQALAPTTEALLDRMSPLEGRTVIDAACGGGDVTMTLAERVGPRGQVIGLDLDAIKIAEAGTTAAERGFSHVRFDVANILEPWPAGKADLVYARLILTHLATPETLLDRARQALVPGGRIVVEDIDTAGMFWDPHCPAMERLRDLYIATAHHRGVDPFIGRRLGRMLEAAGFCDVGTSLVHPYGREGDAKISMVLIAPAVADAAITAKLAAREEMEAMGAELKAFAARPDTTISLPRMFQAWGTRR
jgi:SAM-dependent methyltransferase